MLKAGKQPATLKHSYHRLIFNLFYLCFYLAPISLNFTCIVFLCGCHAFICEPPRVTLRVRWAVSMFDK